MTKTDYTALNEAQSTIFPFARSFDLIAMCFAGIFYFLWPLWYTIEDKGSFRIGEILIEYLLVAIILLFAVRGIFRSMQWRTVGPLVILVIYAAISLSWSIEPKLGLGMILNIMVLFAFASLLSKTGGRRNVVCGLFVAGVILMLGKLAYWMVFEGELTFPLTLPYYVDSNQAATAAGVALIITVCYLAEPVDGRHIAGPIKLIAIVVISLTGLFVLFSGSRTGLVATFAGVSLVSLVRLKPDGKLTVSNVSVLILMLSFCVLIAAILPYSDTTLVPLLQRYDAGFLRGDLGGRNLIWNAALKYSISSQRILFLGGGAGSFDQEVIAYADTYIYFIATQHGLRNPRRPFPHFAAHNDFIRIVCELGLLGIVLLTSFYWRFFKHCLTTSNNRDLRLGLGILVVILLSASGIDILSSALFPMSMALVLTSEHKYAGSSGQKKDTRIALRTSRIVRTATE